MITAHSLPSAASGAIGTSAGPCAGTCGAGKSANTTAASAISASRCSDAARRGSCARAGTRRRRPGPAARAIVSSSIAWEMRDQRPLAQHLRLGGHLARRRSRRRSTAGRSRRACARGPAPPAPRARARGTRRRGAAGRRPPGGRRGSPDARAPGRGRRSAAPTCGSSRRRGPCAPRRRRSPGTFHAVFTISFTVCSRYAGLLLARTAAPAARDRIPRPRRVRTWRDDPPYARPRSRPAHRRLRLRRLAPARRAAAPRPARARADARSRAGRSCRRRSTSARATRSPAPGWPRRSRAAAPPTT